MASNKLYIINMLKQISDDLEKMLDSDEMELNSVAGEFVEDLQTRINEMCDKVNNLRNV